MDWQAFLLDRPIGVIATVSESGLPHAVPIEVYTVDGKVYSWCHRSSLKARNVEATGVAAITAYQGHTRVLVRGPARLLDETDPSYTQVARGFLDKYRREETYGNDCLIELTPEKIVAG